MIMTIFWTDLLYHESVIQNNSERMQFDMMPSYKAQKHAVKQRTLSTMKELNYAKFLISNKVVSAKRICER